jgi:hypothetical protein
MTDLDSSVDDSGASAEAPSTSVDETAIEAMVSRAIGKALGSTLDKRFSGFQSMIDSKVSNLASAVEQLKTAGLSPEEQEQLEYDEQKGEIERLRTENAMLSLRKDHPDAVDFFVEAMSQGSLEDQIAFIEARLGKAVAAAVEDAIEEGGELDLSAVPVTDPNNPARKQKALGAATAAGQPMTDVVADAILANAPRGALRMLRRQKTA